MRVVITGVGLITPLGDDADAVLDAMIAGERGIGLSLIHISEPTRPY